MFLDSGEAEGAQSYSEKIGAVIYLPHEIASGLPEGVYQGIFMDESGNESRVIFDANGNVLLINEDGSWRALISEAIDEMLAVPAELQLKLDEFGLSVNQEGVFDNQGVKIGEIVEGELVLSSGLITEQNGVFAEQLAGFDAVELSAWDKLALDKMGITPVTFEGIASKTDGSTVYLPVQAGAELVTEALNFRGKIIDIDNKEVVRLNSGSLMVMRFAQPDGVEIFSGIDNQTGKAVVIAKFNDGEFGKPKPIEYENAVAIVALEFKGNTAWFVIKEGEVRPDTTINYIADVQNLLKSPDLEKLEQKKNDYVEKINKVNGFNFKSWQEMMDYYRVIFASHTAQRGISNFKGDFVYAYQEKEQNPENLNEVIKMSNHGRHFEALGLGWEIVYNNNLNMDLIKVDFINPIVSNELMSEYVGYVDENGQFQDFVNVRDLRENISEESKHEPLYGSQNFKNVLDYLASGKKISHYSILVFSNKGVKGIDPIDLFAVIYRASGNDRYDKFKPEPIYDLAMSEVGLYYRMISDSGLLKKLIFALGLKPDDLVKVIQGLGGDNSFIGLMCGIKVGD